MEIFYNNFWWMIPNLALACLGFVFGLLYLHSRTIFLRVPFFILWLLFFPNTIYLLTDFEHLLIQFPQVDILEGLLLIIQYVVLIAMGFLTYFVGLMPIQTFFKTHKKFKKLNHDYIFIIVNFAVAFGVVLGKVERTHSWYIFTQPSRVLHDVYLVVTNPTLMSVVLLFGVLFNFLYFTFRKRFLK